MSVWLSAVKKGDQEQLKTAFSESMRRQFDQEGWAQVLMTYQDLFRSAFGDYTLEDFSFAFTGGEDSGHVLITFKGMVLPGLRVYCDASAEAAAGNAACARNFRLPR